VATRVAAGALALTLVHSSRCAESISRRARRRVCSDKSPSASAIPACGVCSGSGTGPCYPASRFQRFNRVPLDRARKRCKATGVMQRTTGTHRQHRTCFATWAQASRSTRAGSRREACAYTRVRERSPTRHNPGVCRGTSRSSFHSSVPILRPYRKPQTALEPTSRRDARSVHSRSASDTGVVGERCPQDRIFGLPGSRGESTVSHTSSSRGVHRLPPIPLGSPIAVVCVLGRRPACSSGRTQVSGFP